MTGARCHCRTARAPAMMRKDSGRSPTVRDRHSSAAFWVKGIAEALAAEHLDVSSLFREAGLEFDLLGNPDARFPSDGVSLLWELAVSRSGNPHVGLAGARIAKAGNFGVVTFAMMSAPNLLG